MNKMDLDQIINKLRNNYDRNKNITILEKVCFSKSEKQKKIQRFGKYYNNECVRN